MNKLSFADKCATMLQLLMDAGPLTLDELMRRLATSRAEASEIVNALRNRGGQVVEHVCRRGGKKVLKFAVNPTR